MKNSIKGFGDGLETKKLRAERCGEWRGVLGELRCGELGELWCGELRGRG